MSDQLRALKHRIEIGKRFASLIAENTAVFQTEAGIETLPFTVKGDEARSFNGANLFVLLQVMKDRSWDDARFFTAAQIAESGWTFKPGARGVHLQFLKTTGQDGMLLTEPESLRFQVFNASEIEGVPDFKATREINTSDLVEAASRAGFGTGPEAWMQSLIDLDDNGARTLRLAMAGTLLQTQTDWTHSFGRSLQQYSDILGQEIAAEPLSLFKAIRDAEIVAAKIMAGARLVAQERVSIAMIAETSVKVQDNEVVQQEEAGMAKKKWTTDRIEKMFQERVAVLAVPFADKDRAFDLGAVFYPAQKLWFVPKGKDAEAFKEWNPRVHSLGPVATDEMLKDSFRDAMASIGLDTSKDIIADGKWHNVSVDSKKNKNNKSGTYILSLHAGVNGESFGRINNKDTGESIPWKYDGELLTPEQRARIRADAIMKDETAAREAARLQDLAAIHAAEIWNLGESAEGHGYVLKKGVSAEGLRQVSGAVLLRYPGFHGESGKSVIRGSDNYLIVPMQNAAGQLRAVQAISPDGKIKSFMSGAQKKGTMFILGAESLDVLISSNPLGVAFSEGGATGASFRSGSSLPTIVCFDAGNLETVVAEVTAMLPPETLRVLALDNDLFHVERAIGFLSEKLGLNPYKADGQVVKSAIDSIHTRSVSLGEAIADGEWHQVPQGTYRMLIEHEDQSDAVRSIQVEVVPVNGRKIQSKFSNRGLEAGRVAMATIEQGGGRGLMAIPSFVSLEGRPTDWNDLHQREGLSAMKSKLRAIGLVPKAISQAVVVEDRREVSFER